MGTAALLTVSPRSGVSLNINCNYLSKAALGSSVAVEAQVRAGMRGAACAAPVPWRRPSAGGWSFHAQVVRLGKRVATIDVRIEQAESGELVAQVWGGGACGGGGGSLRRMRWPSPSPPCALPPPGARGRGPTSNTFPRMSRP